jgi:hypothetical protein
MPRRFVPITEEELQQKILQAWELHYEFDPDMGGIAYIRYNWSSLTPQIEKDFKVDVDFENVECGKQYEYLGYDKEAKRCKYAGQPKDTIENQLMGLNTRPSGLTFLGICAGGDWEIPVHFIIYWDGKKLRCYTPTKGNLWNTTTKTAYGNDEKADSANIKKRFPEMLDPIAVEDGEEQDFYPDDLPMRNDTHCQKMLEDIDQRIVKK